MMLDGLMLYSSGEYVLITLQWMLTQCERMEFVLKLNYTSSISAKIKQIYKVQ